VERLKSFDANPSGTRVLDLSYTFMFNKRHYSSEHILNPYNISGCQCAHHEGVRGALIIAPVILTLTLCQVSFDFHVLADLPPAKEFLVCIE
jgi:hypothetical protein